ncbi:hypothetical protein V6N13_053849 [Hibiscus sabdariffa]
MRISGGGGDHVDDGDTPNRCLTAAGRRRLVARACSSSSSPSVLSKETGQNEVKGGPPSLSSTRVVNRTRTRPGFLPGLRP